MSGSSYAYASGRVSGLEESLLSNRTWNQLITAEDRDEVLRILGESWYGNLLQSEGDLGGALRGATHRAEEELAELSNDSNFTRGILLRRDVRNARYLWKNLASGGNGGVEVEPSGMVSVEDIERAWGDSNTIDLLPVQFQNTLEEIQNLHSPTAARLDSVLDKLAARVESENLGKLQEPVGSLPKVKIELRNFLTAARCRSDQLTTSAVEELMLDGGYHTPSEIGEATRVSGLAILLGEKSGFEAAAAALDQGLESGSFLVFQRESDLMILDILERASGDMFSPGPLAAYVLRRELEASHLKMIAAGKAAGIDSRRLSARIPRG
ncbi:MAG: V-type ATPase subunit [Candidatus Fermentibacteria bacterium]|nr:V-type ATPase subunit [Candidatus Fermentibacteria bacterium]